MNVSQVPNPSVAALYEDALVFETGSAITSTGALTAYSGAKTGRSPLDKRIVKEPGSETDIWWGPVNKPMTPDVRIQLSNAQSQYHFFPDVLAYTATITVVITYRCLRYLHPFSILLCLGWVTGGCYDRKFFVCPAFFAELTPHLSFVDSTNTLSRVGLLKLLSIPC